MGNRNEGANIGGPEPGVLTVVMPHINHFRCLFNGPEGGFAHGIGRAHEGDHRAVGGLAGINIKQLYAFHLFDLGGDLADDLHVPSLAEIGDTFNELFHNAGFENIARRFPKDNY